MEQPLPAEDTGSGGLLHPHLMMLNGIGIDLIRDLINRSYRLLIPFRKLKVSVVKNP